MIDFEQYLRSVHYLGYMGSKGSDLEDAFEDWIVDLQVDDLVAYANAWGNWLIDEFEEKVIPDIDGRILLYSGDEPGRMAKLADANGFNRCRRLIKNRLTKFRGT